MCLCVVGLSQWSVSLHLSPAVFLHAPPPCLRRSCPVLGQTPNTLTWCRWWCREWTHCRSSCRPPAAAAPLDRHSSKIQECWHTGAHSRAPRCCTGPCLQTHSAITQSYTGTDTHYVKYTFMSIVLLCRDLNRYYYACFKRVKLRQHGCRI